MSLSMSVQGDSDKIKADLRARALRGLQRATVHLHTACRDVVSKSFPPASKPGEPPRLRTGFGKSNIAFDIDPVTLTARVGVRRNAFYMAVLEVKHGRTWLASTLKRVSPQMQRLLKAEFKSE